MGRPPTFRFRLYIAADAPNSVLASANLVSICRQYLHDRHEIEIVDVLKHPARALSDSVFMTPMLLKLSPAPPRRIVGTLAQTLIVVQALGLEGARG